MNSSEIELELVCQGITNERSRGIFYGDNPLDHTTPTVLAQLSLSSLLSALTQYILTPLGESAFISLLLVGFFLGPSLWGDKHSFLSKVYSAKSINVSSTFAFFGCILYLFLLGIKMDMGMVKRAGRKAVVIGLFTFIFPITLNLIVAEILTTNMEMDQYLHDRVPYIAVFQSVTTFHVIVCLVTDLKLINSELGQLAISSSMISGTCSWSLAIFFLFIDRDETHDLIALILITAILLVMIIFFLLRPIMIWMTRKTSEGKQIKETYVTSIFIMLLGCAFLSEVFGHHVLFGAVTLGMAVPHGPPLGSALVNKIESFVSSILLPSYFVFSVAGVNIFSIHLKTVTVVSIFGVSSFIGKVLGSMLPALYFKIPPSEAFSLGLVMSCQGISDVLLIQHGRFLSLLDTQIYSIMVINMLFLSGTFTPIIKLLYDPSKRQESVNDCVELIRLITSVENSFDLILVGRSYRSRSPLFEALTEWSEFPELGFMGDILTQSDSRCRVSVLVVQQQISGA
ncbi:hypothetical protein OIU78_023167 [Salix suchowensis]|nr:hypothetical protein OIU78_023167 [Salix suchowensis]